MIGGKRANSIVIGGANGRRKFTPGAVACKAAKTLLGADADSPGPRAVPEKLLLFFGMPERSQKETD